MEPGILQMGLVVFAALQTIYYYHKLPAMVASHFGAGGGADGWSSTSSFFFTYWIVIAVALVVSLGIPALIGRLPRNMISLPNKEYWLSDERYAQTLSHLRNHFRWFGVILLLFLVFVFQMVFQANLSQRLELGAWFIPALVGFLIAVLVWVIRFTTKFSKIE